MEVDRLLDTVRFFDGERRLDRSRLDAERFADFDRFLDEGRLWGDERLDLDSFREDVRFCDAAFFSDLDRCWEDL